MKRNTIFAIITGFVMIFLAACGGGGSTEKGQTTESEKQPEQEVVMEDEPSILAEQLELGKKIYMEKCIVCHQADAKGLPGAFPPLAYADYLRADLKRAVSQTLNGSFEEMIVNGQKYNAPMVPQVETIEEAVAVINFVLKEFNGFTEDKLVKIEDVSDIVINPIQL